MDSPNSLPTRKSLFVETALNLLRSDLSFEDSKSVDIFNLYTCGSEPQLLARSYRKCIEISTKNYRVTPTLEDIDNWLELHNLCKRLEMIDPSIYEKEYDGFQVPERPDQLMAPLRKLRLDCWNRLQCDNMYRQFMFDVRTKSERLRDVLNRAYGRLFQNDDYDNDNIDQWFSKYVD